jgi:hypothetical protein
VIRSEVAEHPASPSQGLVRFIPVHDHAEIPNVQILEGRIEFAGKKGFFIVKVSLDRIDGVEGKDRNEFFTQFICPV